MPKNSSTDPNRIAIFVATSGHSGVDRTMHHLIPALARRNYQVDLLKIRKHGPNLPEVPSNVRILDMGTSHVYSALPRVATYLRRNRPAVMLSDKDRVNRTALLSRALARTRTRLVFSSGTTISIDLATRGAFERWLQRNSMGKLYPFADNIIVTSAGVADDMAQYTGLSRERINVVPCPVVPAHLFTDNLPRPDHPWFKEGEPPVILGVGELGYRKDFQTLLRAFAQLRAERSCRLVILGKGKQREELLSLARSLNIEKDLDLAGFQPNPYHFMAHAALFAFTSRWEGLGFVLIEALAVGTPVVSTDCPSGPKEILADGKYGHLVPVEDVDSLVQAMARTLDTPLPRKTLQEAAIPYEIERSTTAYLKAMGLAPRDS